MSGASSRASRVIFRVAAGPRCGFGHLVRCRSLARALGVEPRVSVRATAATRAIAASLDWSVVDVDSDLRFKAASPELLVVDDPSPADVRAWVQRARRLGVPVATIHDLGVGYADSDLIVDGSVGARAIASPAKALLGPQFAILHPAYATVRHAPQPFALRVLIALGGGSHVRQLAGDLCREIARRTPNADIHVARGFVSGHREPALPAGQWVSAPGGLANELSQAAVAVVAGGVTLYEACALGVPVVGLAVTGAQHQTVRSMAHRGAVIDGGHPPATEVSLAQTADCVARLLQDQQLRRRFAKTARSLVDGRGVFRVAQYLRRLIDDDGPTAMARRGTRAA